MRKELRPVHDLVACDLCERTILKGERIEVFVAAGDRRNVCELCTVQALRLGWQREAGLGEGSPERDRVRPHRPLWTRVVQWAEDQGLLGGAAAGGNGDPELAVPPRGLAPEEPANPAADAAGADRPAAAQPPAEDIAITGEPSSRHPSSRAKRLEEQAARELDASGDDPRRDGWAAAWGRRPGRQAPAAGFKELLGGRRHEPHEVHAVPTSREGKLDRAFELFNASEHRRTVAGISRALGEPWVSASPVGDAATAREVSIVVAWELSWYRYRVDLHDADQPVLLLDRGDEIDDLDEVLRGWNAAADDAGCLGLAAEPIS